MVRVRLLVLGIMSFESLCYSGVGVEFRGTHLLSMMISSMVTEFTGTVKKWTVLTEQLIQLANLSRQPITFSLTSPTSNSVPAD